MKYIYGMRLRPFSPGSQPKDGLVFGFDDPSGEYHSIMVYNRKLTPDERDRYELVLLSQEVPVQCAACGNLEKCLELDCVKPRPCNSFVPSLSPEVQAAIEELR